MKKGGPKQRNRDVSVIPRDVIDASTRGPQDERQDAQTQASRAVASSAADLMTKGILRQVQSFSKASGPSHSGIHRPVPGMAMAHVDLGEEGQKHLQLTRPVGLGFEKLREIVQRDVVLDLIIRHRVRQVQRYLRPSRFDWQPGFRLGFADPNRSVTDADGERFMWLTNFLLNCGAEFDPRRRRAMNRDSLKDFAAKHVRDSLTLDAAPVELVPTVGGRVHGFVAVDGANVFLTDPNSGLNNEYHGVPDFNRATGRIDQGDPSKVIAVYAKDSIVRAHYTHEDMMYPIRNPTSEERFWGYGRPEVEELLTLVTAFLNALTLNMRSISDNSIPKGILTAMGDFTEEDVEELKGQWANDVTGPSNRFRMPVVFSPDAESTLGFVPTGEQVNEVLYSRWITLLVALKCSMFGIQPEEIAFEAYSAGGKSAMSGSDTEEKITSSKDSGLFTLVNWFGDTLNEVVATVDPDVRLEWTGLETSKEEEQAREDKTLTWGELRKRYSIPSDGIDDELLDTPLNQNANSVYMQGLQAKRQEEQMKQQQAMQPEQPGEPGPHQDEDGNLAEADPDGNPQFQDHEGGAWGAQPGEPGPGQPGAKMPGGPQAFAKAYEADLTWPGGGLL